MFSEPPGKILTGLVVERELSVSAVSGRSKGDPGKAASNRLIGMASPTSGWAHGATALRPTAVSVPDSADRAVVAMTTSGARAVAAAALAKRKPLPIG